MPLLSIIIVNFNDSDIAIVSLKKSLAILDQYLNDQYEIILIDNCSTDDSLHNLRHLPCQYRQVKIYSSGYNGGFGYGCNYGARHAESDLFWFLNHDAWITEISSLKSLFTLMEKKSTGAVGTLVFTQEGLLTPQAGGTLSFKYVLGSSFRVGSVYRGLPIKYREIVDFLLCKSKTFSTYRSSLHSPSTSSYEHVTAVGGASFLIRKDVYCEVDGFDENFFLYDEDGDLCLRLNKAGYSNYLFNPIAVHTINHSSTSKINKFLLKRIKLKSRHLFVKKHFDGFERFCLHVISNLTWWAL